MAVLLSALSVILTVLKIIGIVLLCIIGLVLAILLIVLFVPVRYGGDGSFKMDGSGKDYAFKAKASWLLHIVTVLFNVKDPSGVVIKIFGIRLGGKKDKDEAEADSGKKKKRRKKDQDLPAAETDVEAESAESSAASEPEVTGESGDADAAETAEERRDVDKTEANAESGDAGTAKTDEEPGDADAAENGEDAGESAESGKDKKRGERFKDKHRKKADKKPGKRSGDKKDFESRGLYDKIKRYADIIRSDDFKQSFALCKKMVGKLLKAILPKKWEVNGKVGFEDPSLTGYVCGITGAMYMWMRKHIHINGLFDVESNDIDVDGYFKGRIFVVTLVYVFLKVWFNKKVRRVLDLFKDEPEGED